MAYSANTSASVANIGTSRSTRMSWKPNRLVEQSVIHEFQVKTVPTRPQMSSSFPIPKPGEMKVRLLLRSCLPLQRFSPSSSASTLFQVFLTSSSTTCCSQLHINLNSHRDCVVPTNEAAEVDIVRFFNAIVHVGCSIEDGQSVSGSTVTTLFEYAEPGSLPQTVLTRTFSMRYETRGRLGSLAQ